MVSRGETWPSERTSKMMALALQLPMPSAWGMSLKPPSPTMRSLGALGAAFIQASNSGPFLCVGGGFEKKYASRAATPLAVLKSRRRAHGVRISEAWVGRGPGGSA